jgi:hypothetical protein
LKKQIPRLRTQRTKAARAGDFAFVGITAKRVVACDLITTSRFKARAATAWYDDSIKEL